MSVVKTGILRRRTTLAFEKMNLERLALLSCCTLFLSCRGPISTQRSESEGKRLIEAATNRTDEPIPQRNIDGLEDRIASMPKGSALPVSQVLSHLGLWKYRLQMRSFRRSNVVGLELNQTETILFVAEEEATAAVRGESHVGTEWDRNIKHLHIWRIIYRGVYSDFK